jgi:putative hydrolase of the HAD superfamily
MVKPKRFKLIVFDIDNTLIYRLPRPAQILLAFARRQGMPTHPDALQRAERRSYAYYADGQADEERALLGATVFRRNYVTALLQAICTGDDSDPVQIEPLLDAAIARLNDTERPEYCPEDVRQVVRQLSEAGYHLSAISNRDGDLHPLLTAHGLSAYFSFTLSGGRAGVYKPNPEIFRIALKTLGVAPAATLAVGDSYQADIVGAQKIGITGVLLDPFDFFPEAQCRTIKHLNELIPWLL